MSEIVKDLMLTSAEWYTEEEANRALTEGMENITKVVLTDCRCKTGTVKLDRDTDVIGGAYHDIRIVSGNSIGSQVVGVGLMGVYLHNLDTDSFRSEVTISSNEAGDYTDIYTATINGVASIGDADICWMTIGSLGHVEIWAGAHIKELEIYGSAFVHSRHVDRIIVHAGGKVKLVGVINHQIECDRDRVLFTNEQGWICG